MGSYRGTVPRACVQCGEGFFETPGRVAMGYGKYCSRACYHATLPGRILQPTIDRFWARVEKTKTCWLWTGKLKSNGYASFSADGRRMFVHRYAYELLVGPIPDGLELDHVKARGCVNHNCVNPAHLEPVTGRENVIRSDSFTGKNARKTHCPQGHPYEGENLAFVLRTGDKHPSRICRACKRARDRTPEAREYQRRDRERNREKYNARRRKVKAS